MAKNPLPEFLRYVRQAAQKPAGAHVPRVPLGNDLPQDGGIKGRMPRYTMEQRTGEGDILVDSSEQPARAVARQVAANFAADPKGRAVRSPPVAAPPAQPVGVVAPVRQPSGPVVTNPGALPLNMPAVPAVPAPYAPETEPIPIPEGPTVSRADRNAALRESGLRPDRKLFESGNRVEDLEDRREALDAYEPQKRSWWKNVKANLLPSLLGGLRTGDPLGAVGGVLSGVTVGTADRKSADKIWRNRERAEVEGQLKGEYKRGDAAAATAKTMIEARNAAVETDEKRRRDEADNLFKSYNGTKEFDPDATDPQTVKMMRTAGRLGISLPKKAESDKFTLGMAPDGTAIVLNTREGTTREVGNHAKPKEIKPDDLPDTLFGLPDEKMIGDEARAAVAPDLKSRRLTDYAAKHYQTADGQFDEAKVWQDIEDGVVRPSEIWENVTSQDDQRLAGARNKVREKYKALRAEADKFRLRVSRVKPKPDAPAKSVNDLVDLFNEYSQIKDGKKRREMLDALYQSLDYVNVQ